MNRIALHILLISSAILFLVGLLVIIGIADQKAGLTELWPWLLGLPVGGAGILITAHEDKQK